MKYITLPIITSTLILSGCAMTQESVKPDSIGLLINTDHNTNYTGTTYMVNWDVE